MINEASLGVCICMWHLVYTPQSFLSGLVNLLHIRVNWNFSLNKIWLFLTLIICLWVCSCVIWQMNVSLLCCLLFSMFIPKGVSSWWLYVSSKETETCRANRSGAPVCVCFHQCARASSRWGESGVFGSLNMQIHAYLPPTPDSGENR